MPWMDTSNMNDLSPSFKEMWSCINAIQFEDEDESIPAMVQPDHEAEAELAPETSFETIPLDHLSHQQQYEVRNMAEPF